MLSIPWGVLDMTRRKWTASIRNSHGRRLGMCLRRSTRVLFALARWGTSLNYISRITDQTGNRACSRNMVCLATKSLLPGSRTSNCSWGKHDEVNSSRPRGNTFLPRYPRCDLHSTRNHCNYSSTGSCLPARYLYMLMPTVDTHSQPMKSSPA